jgi:large subunit ribosomal protein L3
MTTGLIGKKLGMTRVFADNGRWVPVTVLEAGPCTVVQRKTQEQDGYEAVQVGFGERKENRCNKPAQGHFAKAGVAPKRHLREFRLEGGEELNPGDEIKADVFAAGDFVDVVGMSKGKGFQGVVKRHGFGGGPDTHGSHFHRMPGSVGQAADPSKIFKGIGLPGQMGNKRVTVKNLEVVAVDAEKNVILVRGSVPGANGSAIVVKKSAKSAKGAQ